MKSNNTYSVNINTTSLFKLLVVLGGVWAIFILREVIVLAILAFILSSGIILAAKTISQYSKIPYTLSVFFILALLAGIATVLFQLIVPTISNEFTTLVNNFPQLLEELNIFVGNILDIEDFSVIQYINMGGSVNIGQVTWDVVTGVLFTTQNVINTMFYVGFLVVTTFYMAIQPKNLDEIIVFFFPAKKQKMVSHNISLARSKVGYWLAGQCLISFILASITYPALLLLGVPYALLLAVIAAFLNLIPIIGPILSSIPAIILALIIDFRLAVITGVFYLVIQQIDGNFMTPIIMRKVTGIHPLIVMIIILLGTSLAGALGALIALPVVSVISIFVKELED